VASVGLRKCRDLGDDESCLPPFSASGSVVEMMTLRVGKRNEQEQHDGGKILPEDLPSPRCT
jgi:hypothetical protein